MSQYLALIGQYFTQFLYFYFIYLFIERGTKTYSQAQPSTAHTIGVEVEDALGEHGGRRSSLRENLGWSRSGTLEGQDVRCHEVSSVRVGCHGPNSPMSHLKL